MSALEQIASLVRARMLTRGETSDICLARHVLDCISLGSVHADESVAPVCVHGELHWYDGDRGVWVGMSRKELRGLVQELDGADMVDGNSGNSAGRLRLAHTRVDAIAKAILDSRQHLDEAFFAEQPLGVAFADCFVRVTADGPEVTERSPDNRILAALPYRYAECAECAEWDAVLDRVFYDDADADEKTAALQEFAGACMVGIAARYTKCFVLVGDGENGKSVVGETIRDLLIPDGLATEVAPQMFGREYYVGKLRGMRLNLCNELPVQDMRNAGVFKDAVDGGMLLARRPYGDPYSFAPTCGHLFSANELPGTFDNSHGFWRRFLLLQFNRDFTKADGRDTKAGIKARLAREAPGIAMWALRGAVALMRQGHYTVPSSHKEAIEDWQLQADPVRAFVDECCQASEGHTSLQLIYDSYGDWCQQSGRRRLARTRVGARLRSLKIDARRTKSGMAYQLDVLPKGDWAPGKYRQSHLRVVR